MLARLTDCVSSPRGKWITLLVWLAVSIALLSQLPRLNDVLENEEALFLPGDAESTRAFEVAREQFPGEGTPALVIVREANGLSAGTQETVANLAAWLASPDAPANIVRVLPPEPGSSLISPDGTTLTIVISIEGEPAEQPFTDAIEEIRERAAAIDLPGVEIAVGGPGGLIADLVGVFTQIDTILLLVTVLLVLALLLAIYRSPILAAIPLLGVGLVFQVSGGINAWVAEQFSLPISGQTQGIMTVLLFGTGTDYVLFVSARFREELTRHADKHEAMRQTMRGVGGAVASAGATILIASAALGFASLRSYQTLGPVIAIAVAVMMLAAVTLIPAVLTILGKYAYWPVKPRPAAEQPPSGEWRRSLYGRIGVFVLKRPGTTLSITVAGLALLVSGLLAYEPTSDRLAALPDSVESVRGYELLRQGFPPGELAQTSVYVSLPPGERVRDPGPSAAIDALTLALDGHPAVARASGPSRPAGVAATGPWEQPEAAARFISADGRTARIDLALTMNPYAEESLDAIAELRDLARASASAAGLSSGDVLIGGATAEFADARDAGNRDNMIVLPIILLAIGIVLALLLRSLLAPLYLMATIAFTYFATLGLAVAIFILVLGHEGIGEGVPFYLFVFLNALSIDYNIYLMSRIREEMAQASLFEATGRALSRTGPVITSAGLILAGTFSALMSLPLQDLVQLGFAVAAGVLIDTFITRTVIVPALVVLFGRRGWWPARLPAEAPTDAG